MDGFVINRIMVLPHSINTYYNVGKLEHLQKHNGFHYLPFHHFLFTIHYFQSSILYPQISPNPINQ